MRPSRNKYRCVLTVAGAAGLALLAGCAPATRSGPLPFPNAPNSAWVSAAGVGSDIREAALRSAIDLRGIAYQFGGAEPSSGFDCSGLVRYVFSQHQVEMPRTVAEQYRSAIAIQPRDLTPGDLLFFETTTDGPSHVGIALDRTTFIHAPGEGRVVRVERFDTPYWKSRFLGARRAPASSSR